MVTSQLTGGEKVMSTPTTNTIIVYGKKNCPACVAACNYLTSRALPYAYHDIEQNSAAREAWQQLGRRTVPQIIVNGHHIGGNSDMELLVKANKFDELINT